MFEKNMKITYLLDLYADVLDGHVSEVMRSYYDDDLSLAEIAEGLGISRQGVRHLIKKGEEQLDFLEERLGLAARDEELSEAGDSLLRLADRLEADGDRIGDVAELRRIAEVITKGSQDVPRSN
jgi:predicted DNA-binding protein YlxM (UPF0122 family)